MPISLRLSQPLEERVNCAAKRLNTTKTEIIKHSLEDYLPKILEADKHYPYQHYQKLQPFICGSGDGSLSTAHFVTIDKSQLKFPAEVCNKLHLYDGQKLLLETTQDNTIQLKPFEGNEADRKLLELLNHPFDMGKIKFKDRGDIYDDID